VGAEGGVKKSFLSIINLHKFGDMCLNFKLFIIEGRKLLYFFF